MNEQDTKKLLDLMEDINENLIAIREDINKVIRRGEQAQQVLSKFPSFPDPL